MLVKEIMSVYAETHMKSKIHCAGKMQRRWLLKHVVHTGTAIVTL
jgi:hypothetical protein